MFLMASRLKGEWKGYPVPEARNSSNKEQDAFDLRSYLGGQNQLKRKKLSEISLKNHIPSIEEIQLLHSILFNQTSKSSVDEESHSEEFKLEKVIYAHEQNKNVHGKLFGGNIMRESFEIAFMTAYLLGNGEVPELYHIGDTQVEKRLIEVHVSGGCRLHFEICGASGLHSGRAGQYNCDR